MSLSLNQPTPRLNDLLLRGGDDLSPELKEQALDDILAEFGSAPAKKAPAQTAPKPNPGFSSAPSGPLTPEAEAEAIRGSHSPSADSLSYRFCAAGLCSGSQCRTGKVRVPVPRDRRDRLFGISERRPD